MPETPRILLHNDATHALAMRLEARFPGADFVECNSNDGLPDMIASYRPAVVYTVRFGGTSAYPGHALFSEGGPRWVANGGAGTDHFGIWDTERTTVTNAAGVAADMMAEYVIGGFLHFSLDIPGFQTDKAARRWQARTVRPLNGTTLLIVGLGQIGQAIAARAKAFGMRVIGTRARPVAMDNVDHVGAASDLRTLLPQADFIAVSTPLTDQTRGLIGPAEFRSMKQGAVFADVSRGGVTDQTALLKALQGNRLTGAVLDVFETEPLPPESPLWAVENAIMSPHCSSVYDGWEEASFDVFLDNLARWVAGRELVNIVDPDRGY